MSGFVMSRRQHFKHLSPQSGCSTLPPPLPCISLSLGGSDIDMLFMHGPSVVTCFLCFDELCVSTFSVVTAKRLRAALIDKHKHKYLGGGFRT